MCPWKLTSTSTWACFCSDGSKSVVGQALDNKKQSLTWWLVSLIRTHPYTLWTHITERTERRLWLWRSYCKTQIPNIEIKIMRPWHVSFVRHNIWNWYVSRGRLLPMAAKNLAPNIVDEPTQINLVKIQTLSKNLEASQPKFGSNFSFFSLQSWSKLSKKFLQW